MNTQINSLIENIEKIIVGKRDSIIKVVCAVLAEGHILIEDVPGVGKTRLVSALANSVDGKFNRIQLTPDIMPSDIVGFSMIDPQTEVVQAIGRFRNGVAQAYHITNTSDSLPCISRETLNHQLICAENIYNQVATIKTENDIERDVLLQALNGMDYKRFITRDGKRNHFMWDNAWEDEKISGYYQSPSALEAAYADAPFHTKIYHYKAPVTDEDRLRRQSGRLNAKELWQEVTAQLTKLTEDKPEAEASYLMEELGDEFCVMVKAFMQLGAERIETLRQAQDRSRIGL